MKIPESILVALVSAGAAIVVALITSGIFVRTVQIKPQEVWELKRSNVEYTAATTGMVITVVSASTTYRSITASGYVDDQLVAATGAQDGTNPQTPSIGVSSFTMPVPRGAKWRVNVEGAKAGQVQVRWFASNPTLR